jgi:hypothetical protein
MEDRSEDVIRVVWWAVRPPPVLLDARGSPETGVLSEDMKSMFPSHLPNDVLVRELRSLAQRHREATARLVAFLAEMDTRRLYLGEGFPSLFQYCRQVLRLSESEAYSRIEAARAALRKRPAPNLALPVPPAAPAPAVVGDARDERLRPPAPPALPRLP